jgi:hypothetical protein
MAQRNPATTILACAFTALAACGSAPEASPADQAQAAPKPASASAMRFTAEQGGRRQSLEIRKRDGGLDVAIAVAGSCTRSETGVAKAVKSSGDVDIEEDAEGEGYPTDSFVLAARDTCRVTIRLAAPDRELAWLRESGCDAACPLSSVPMTRK